MRKCKALIQTPLMRSIFWFLILIVVLIFWPREHINASNPEPEIVYIYVYTNEDPREIKEEVVEIKEVKKEDKVIKKPKYGFTKNDIYLLTVLLCGSGKKDGDGEYDIDFNKDGKTNCQQTALVLGVVMNRVMSKRFPNTVSEVVWAKGQFSLMYIWKNNFPKVSDKSYQIVKKWCEAYDNHDMSVMTIPQSHLYFSGNGKVNKSREGW